MIEHSLQSCTMLLITIAMKFTNILRASGSIGMHSHAWPYPPLQRKEGVWGLALQPAIPHSNQSPSSNRSHDSWWLLWVGKLWGGKGLQVQRIEATSWVMSWSTTEFESAITAAGKSVEYHSLKTEQQHRAVTAIPTGFGKSLCYGCLPRVFDCLKGTESKSVVVVVTPLLALMED